MQEDNVISMNASEEGIDPLTHLLRSGARQLEGELQLIESQVSDLLREDGVNPTEAAVQDKLQTLAKIKKREIGKRGLAICQYALYDFAANTRAVVLDIVRNCK